MLHPIIRIIVIVCCLFSPVVRSASADGRPIVTTDLLKLRWVSSIDVARDGTVAIYAVHSIQSIGADAEGRPQYANQSHLYLAPLGARAEDPRQLTFGARTDRAPRFSPDGSTIAFLRPGAEGGADQIWLMPVNGGEARVVTNVPTGAGDVQWSPDGRRLMFASSLSIDDLEGAPSFSSERPERDWNDASIDGVVARPDGTRAEIRAWLAENARRSNPNIITRLDFLGEQSVRSAMRIRHLFMVDVAGPEREPRRITQGYFDHGHARFMPDGRSIVYASEKAAAVHPDRVRRESIWRIKIDGTDDHELVAIDGMSVARPKPSADGSVLAFVGHDVDDHAFGVRRLGIASINGALVSEPVWLTSEETFDASVSSYAWRRTSFALLFNAQVGGGNPLMTMDPGLLEPATVVDQIDGLPVGVRQFAAGGGAIVYSLATAQNPCSLHVRDARGDRPVHDLNAWTAECAVSLPTEGWVNRPDSVRVQYWLMKPTDMTRQAKHPLVVQVHGGPNWMWGPGEPSMWFEFQLLCSWGYGVAYANPRGSTGFGSAFVRGNEQSWGDGPGRDVLAMADTVLLEEWVDSDRLAITGGSYGGYLTAWIIAHDHRFKAAVAQRGVYDFNTFFGEGKEWRLVPDHMGGYPWQPTIQPVLKRESPFTFVNRIRTPLLIMHADGDYRAGVIQSQMMYRALKVLERPVEYVRYPDANHFLSYVGDPLQRMDRLNRIIEFFERYVENSAPAPRLAE